MAEHIINSFSKGMHSGIDKSIFPSDSWRMMRNGHILSDDEHGFTVTNIKAPGQSFELPLGYSPIGHAEFDGVLYLILYNGSRVEIGSCTESSEGISYSPLNILIKNNGLSGFNVDASIFGYDGTVKLDVIARDSYSGGVNLYICDGLNANVVISTNTKYTDTDANPLTRSAILMFKTVDDMPKCSGVVRNGGSLRPGTYYTAIRLTTIDYNSTIWLAQAGPFVISSNKRGYLDTNDIRLSKHIRLSVQDADEDYKYLEVAIIRYFGENGSQSVEMNIIDRRFPLSGDIIIRGKEPVRALTMEELLQSNINVTYCNSHVQSGGRYFGAGWAADNQDVEKKLESVALRIIPTTVLKNANVESALADATTRRYDNAESFKFMKYKAGEAYPFAVSFIIGGKYQTDPYPICGYDSNKYTYSQMKRLAESGVAKDYIDPETVYLFNDIDGEDIKSYQVFANQLQAGGILRNDFGYDGYVRLDKTYNSICVTGSWASTYKPVVFFKMALESSDMTHTINDATITTTNNGVYYAEWTYSRSEPVVVHNNSLMLSNKKLSVAATAVSYGQIPIAYSVLSDSFVLRDSLGSIVLGPIYPSGGSDPESNPVYHIADGTYTLHRVFVIRYSGQFSNRPGVVISPLVTYGFDRAYSLKQVGSIDAPTSGTVIEGSIPSDAEYASFASESGAVSVEYGITIIQDDDDLIANKGLYRFPFSTNDAPLRRRLFLDMIGVSFDTDAAEALLQSLGGLNVTGLVFMQGERVENFVSQGISLPMIDKIYTHRSRSNRRVVSVFGLGDGKKAYRFPYLLRRNFAGNVVEDFPVQFSRWIPDDSERMRVWMDYRMLDFMSAYFSKNGITPHRRSGGSYEYGDYFEHATDDEFFGYATGPNTSSTDVDPFVEAGVQFSRLSDCQNFAYISPDEINDTENQFSGYLRTFARLDPSDIRTNQVYTKEALSSSDSMVSSNPTPRKVIYRLDNSTTIGLDWNFSNSFVHCHEKTMQRVPADKMEPDEYGNISRMKGITEIFGDFTMADYNMDFFDANLQRRSRETLSSSGLMLNRFAIRNNQSDGLTLTSGFVDGPGTDTEMYQGWQPRPSLQNVITPTVMTNMSMRSCPYYAYSHPDVLDSDTETIYSDCISEKYNYDPDSESLYDNLLSLFSPMSSLYHVIGNASYESGAIEQIGALYKGDIYAQYVAIRLNRVSYIPTDGNDYQKNHRLGQVMRVYLESTKNHNLRVPTDDSTFWPYSDTAGYNIEDFAFESVQRAFARESFKYNEGYHQLSGPMLRYGVDVALGASTTSKPNTVYYSDKHVSQSIEDAYRNIHTNQFVDVGLGSGPIKKIVELSGQLFTVHTDGIHQLYTSRSLQTAEDSSTIMLGDSNLLSDQTKELANFGTQHAGSVVVADRGFYGIDLRKRKIWYVGLIVSDNGTFFYNAEDLLVTKSCHLLFDDLLISKSQKSITENIFGYGQDMFYGITTGYDQTRKRVYFSIMLEDGIRTVVYDERLAAFTGIYSYTPNIYIPHSGKLYMYSRFNNMRNAEGENSWVVEPETGDDCMIEANGDLEPFELTFYVNGANKGLSNIEKDYILHRLFASPTLLKHEDYHNMLVREIKWSTEYQGSSLDLSALTDGRNDVDKFWKTPIFEEHQWKIPIDVQSEPSDGPAGSGAFLSFEPGATLRGAWLKVTIRYSGKEKIYINNCITEFIISHS